MFRFFAYSNSIRSWEYCLQVSKWFLENCRRYRKRSKRVDDARVRRAHS